jgi:hypothetical protein
MSATPSAAYKRASLTSVSQSLWDDSRNRDFGPRHAGLFCRAMSAGFYSQSEAVLVRHDAPIRSVADLKGKTVALNRGSNVHDILVKLA